MSLRAQLDSYLVDDGRESSSSCALASRRRRLGEILAAALRQILRDTVAIAIPLAHAQQA